MSESHFQVRCSREGEGYLLEYGKGGKKLTADLCKDQTGLWFVRSPAYASSDHKKKGDAVEEWGAWARAKYSGLPAPDVTPSVGNPELNGSPSGSQVPPVPRVKSMVKVILKGRPPTSCTAVPIENGTSYRDLGGTEYVRILG